MVVVGSKHNYHQREFSSEVFPWLAKALHANVYRLSINWNVE